MRPRAMRASTGTLGVVLVTSGPGVGNTITGLLDAHQRFGAGAVHQRPGRHARRSAPNAFQECDALGMSRPVTKWNAQVAQRRRRSRTSVRKALRDRDAGPARGRCCSTCRRTSSCAPCVPRRPRERSCRAPQPQARRACRPRALQRAADLLASARRPVFYGGGGLINSGPAACAAFTRLVRRTDAPCTLTLMGLGAFPASDPHFLGMLGMHGTLEANLAMHEADLVVCVGARFDDRVTGKLERLLPARAHRSTSTSTRHHRQGGEGRRAAWSATAARCSTRCWRCRARRHVRRRAGSTPWWQRIDALARRATASASRRAPTPSCRSS